MYEKNVERKKSISYFFERMLLMLDLLMEMLLKGSLHN